MFNMRYGSETVDRIASGQPADVAAYAYAPSRWQHFSE